MDRTTTGASPDTGGQASSNGTERRWEPEEPEWLHAAAFTFVILALLILAVTPALLLQRVARTSEGVAATLLPAYDAMRDYALAMEHRVSSARSRFISDDPRYDERLDAARAAEEIALARLEAVAPRISPAFSDHLGVLRRHASERNALEARVIRGGEDPDLYRSVLPRFDAQRDSMAGRLARLREELGRVTDARMDREARWTQRQRSLSLLIGVSALFAALLVGWFAWRQRQLSRELQAALRDATRQRALAERRGDELERSTEARVRLLRGITHDVKNPLGAAKGYADLLQMEVKSPLLPEQAPFVEGIRRSVDGALAIIGELLDLARADSGGLAVHRREIDLAALVRTAVEDHRTAAEAAGHTLNAELPAEPLSVHTDPTRVLQVLGNLLSNAIKYSPPPGFVTVRVGIAADAEVARDGAWAEIRVEDSGPGIPATEREAVFDEFTRLDDGGAQKGHGLGLAIARRIARLLGGDLTVAEAGGGGAAFSLWLPLGQEAEPGTGTRAEM